MSLGSLIYLFVWWATVYTLFTLGILIAIQIKPFWKWPAYTFLFFCSFKLLMLLQETVPDQLHVVPIYIMFQAPPLLLWGMYWALHWTAQWFESDPIVGGVNIRKSIDRKQ